MSSSVFFFFFQAEDGIRDYKVTGVQTCALPICLARTLADDPRERDHLDLARPALAQGGSRGCCGRAARIDVVDEADPRGRPCGRSECTGDVTPAFGPCQPALVRDRARPREQRLHREVPACAELMREPLRR